jgi:hypothetical protein
MTGHLHLIPHEDDLRINDPRDILTTDLNEAEELRERAAMYYRRAPDVLTERQIAVYGTMEVLGTAWPR